MDFKDPNGFGNEKEEEYERYRAEQRQGQKDLYEAEAKSKKKREADAKFANHRMAWLYTVLPRRIYVGPFIAGFMDAGHLNRTLNVTHIVNLRPVTDRVSEKTKINMAHWYTVYWEKEEYAPHLVREPLPDDFATQKTAKQIAFYLASAERVAALLVSADTVCVYVHDDRRPDAEAVVALLAWQIAFPDTFPADLMQWATEQGCDHLVDNEERLALIQEACEMHLEKIRAKKHKNASGQISGWIKRK